MQVILRNDFFFNGVLHQRSEPWTEPVEVPDDMIEHMPKSAYIVTVPEGWRFKEGVVAGEARRSDVERISEDKQNEAEQDAANAAAIAKARARAMQKQEE